MDEKVTEMLKRLEKAQSEINDLHSIDTKDKHEVEIEDAYKAIADAISALEWIKSELA